MAVRKAGYKRLRKRPAKLDVSYGSVKGATISPVGLRYSTGIAGIFGDSGYLDALLKAEAASSSALSSIYPEKIPERDSRKIKSVADTLHVLPSDVRKTEAMETHHEMGAVIKELAAKAGKSGRYVHYAMTSADAVETGKALQLRDGLKALIETVEAVRDASITAAKEWRDIPCILRTHGQHAMPGSFGLPFAFFGYCLDKSAARLGYDLKNMVEGKLSGAIGTYDVSADEGMDGFLIEKKALGSLGIRPAGISMQTPPREGIACIISDLAVLCGRIESMAHYIKTLKRTEILEIEEPQESGTVSSSAMPHKNIHGNPYIEERCISIARTVRGFALTELESVASEDFRDLTASLSDRVAVPEAFVLTDYSCRLMENVVNRIDPVLENIERNLEATKGAVTSQRLMSRLIARGASRERARAIVREAAAKAYASNIQYREALLSDQRVLGFLSRKEITELSDPRTYMGRSREMIDRIASKYLKARHATG
ncbi:MAG: lyase family protein [Candidatus Marsarchaeota archaeon]|nr:lyase family protein [Candidatus Marsarchaeota archaeon]MCL5419871.1 lyase family protein [Candidatus Marsarchaeota archaeon]